MNWYLQVLKKYAVFDGRARRKEYWMFTLFNVIAFIVLSLVGRLLGDIGTFLPIIYVLAVLIPSIAVSIRRLHDIGKSGWWILIGLVPAVGGLILLVFMVLPGTLGDNAFGADPKAGEVAAV